jgi:hypothetical protein
MPGGPDAERLYVCITHVELPVAFPPFVTPLYVGQAQAEGRLNLRDIAPDWVPFHPLLGGAAGTFAVRQLLLGTCSGARSVGLCQYRKFVSRERASTVAADSYKSIDLVKPQDLAPERFAALMKPGPEPFLVSRLFHMRHKGCLGQYAEVHRAQDLLRFTAEAVSQGVLSGPEAKTFLNDIEMIPGGLELGVFPVDFWLPAITAVESVVRACITRDPIDSAGYQSRAWAFCAERLGSHLVLRHFRAIPGAGGGRSAWRTVERLKRLRPSHWQRRFVGRLNVIADAADYAPGST